MPIKIPRQICYGHVMLAINLVSLLVDRAQDPRCSNLPGNVKQSLTVTVYNFTSVQQWYIMYYATRFVSQCTHPGH